jgi:hypothetical protein
MSKGMTAEERAREIHIQVHAVHPETDKCINYIAEQIRQAVDEARATHSFTEACCDACFLTGFKDARERAATLALTITSESECPDCGDVPQDHIADAIRALQPGEGKP